MRTWFKLAILTVAVAVGGGLRADDTKKPGDKPGSDNKSTRTDDDKRSDTKRTDDRRSDDKRHDLVVGRDRLTATLVVELAAVVVRRVVRGRDV